jgi:hypothetical protein
MLSELTHIQEIVQSLCMVSNDPESLPASTEHLIIDLLKTGSDTEQQQTVRLIEAYVLEQIVKQRWLLFAELFLEGISSVFCVILLRVRLFEKLSTATVSPHGRP